MPKCPKNRGDGVHACEKKGLLTGIALAKLQALGARGAIGAHLGVLRECPKGVTLRPHKAGIALQQRHLPRTVFLVEMVVHLDVALRLASRAMVGVEGRVASRQDVDLGIEELGVAMHVLMSVSVAQMQRHTRSTLGRVFAVEYEDGVAWTGRR